MSFIYKWFMKKVERCPYCNKLIAKKDFLEHKRKCKREKKRQRKLAKKKRHHK